MQGKKKSTKKFREREREREREGEKLCIDSDKFIVRECE